MARSKGMDGGALVALLIVALIFGGIGGGGSDDTSTTDDTQEEQVDTCSDGMTDAQDTECDPSRPDFDGNENGQPDPQ